MNRNVYSRYIEEDEDDEKRNKTKIDFISLSNLLVELHSSRGRENEREKEIQTLDGSNQMLCVPQLKCHMPFEFLN